MGLFFWNVVLFPFPVPVTFDPQARAQLGVAQESLGVGSAFLAPLRAPGRAGLRGGGGLWAGGPALAVWLQGCLVASGRYCCAGEPVL